MGFFDNYVQRVGILNFHVEPLGSYHDFGSIAESFRMLGLYDKVHQPTMIRMMGLKKALELYPR